MRRQVAFIPAKGDQAHGFALLVNQNMAFRRFVAVVGLLAPLALALDANVDASGSSVVTPEDAKCSREFIVLVAWPPASVVPVCEMFSVVGCDSFAFTLL